jgi:hypothetical protein
MRAEEFDHITSDTAALCADETQSLEKNRFIRYAGPEGNIINPECEIDKL